MKQKGLRKLVSMIMAVVMVVSMSLTGFAATSYSITINSAADGETYYAYKVFDIDSYSTADKNLVAYTIEANSTFYYAVSRSDLFTLTQIGTSGIYVVELKNSNTDGAAILSKLSEVDLTNVTADGSVDASNSTAIINLTEAGYYYVSTSLGSVVMLNSTTPDVTISDKNGEPTVDKTVREDSDNKYGQTNDADVNQTVTFQTKITDIAGATSLVLHDTMENLAYQGVKSVQYCSSSTASEVTLTSSSDATRDYTVTTDTTDGCTFEISFHKDFTNAENSGYLVVTYTAILTSDAVEKGCGTNSTEVSYGNKQTSEKDKTTTYTYNIQILKYTGTGKTPLGGAKFILSKDVSGTTYYAQVNNGILTGWTTTYADATTLISDNTTGLIDIKGLDADTYTLTETEAPAGYNSLAKPVTIKITGTESSGELTGSYTLTVDNTSITDQKVEIENKAGSLLPSTGGIGTTIFYIVGSVLVIGAAVLFVTKRRLGSED